MRNDDKLEILLVLPFTYETDNARTLGMPTREKLSGISQMEMPYHTYSMRPVSYTHLTLPTKA